MSTTYQGLITITDLTDNKACEIRGVNVFKYNENGEIPSASSSITLTAILSDNISGSNWQYKNSLGNFVDFSPITTSDTITINHTDDIFINDIATIKKLTSDESVFDIFTITKIRDGSPGDALINAVLSNDNQIIPCDGSGIPFESAFPVSSKITIYEGTEDITNKYSISATIQSDSGVPRLIGSISGSTFTATSWNALSQSYYTATVTFTCTRTGYPPINKVLTLSKVATGSSPNYYELTYDILATNKNISNIFNPSSVTFRANHINGELIEDYQGYLKLYRVKIDGTQETITTSNMNSDDVGGYKYTYTFSQTLDVNTKYLLAELYKTNGVGDCLDKQSIIVTSDGQTGSSPINIVLGNVADIIPCDVDGKLKTNLTINIPFTAYKGTSQISSDIHKTTGITPKPAGLTVDDISVTSSTTTDSGNIEMRFKAGADFGADSGEITLTFTCDGKQVPMKYGWSKSIQAPQGEPGTPGDPGKGISSIIEQWARGTETSADTNSWGTSQPTLTSEYPTLWYRQKIDWINPVDTTYSPSYSGVKSTMINELVTFRNLISNPGYTTINGDKIGSGTITLGGTVNGNGLLEVYDSLNNLVAKLSKDENIFAGFNIKPTAGRYQGDNVNEGYWVESLIDYDKDFDIVPYLNIERYGFDGDRFFSNHDEWYHSKNFGINNSVALSVIHISLEKATHVYMDVLDYQNESQYDYGTVGTIDGAALSNSYSTDYTTTNSQVKWTGYNNHKQNGETIDFGVVAAGEHTIYVRYKKNSSANNQNDCLYFRLFFDYEPALYYKEDNGSMMYISKSKIYQRNVSTDVQGSSISYSVYSWLLRNGVNSLQTLDSDYISNTLPVREGNWKSVHYNAFDVDSIVFQHDNEFANLYFFKGEGSEPNRFIMDTNLEVAGDITVIGLAGEIKMWAGDTIPDGWLLCDGSEVSKTDYPYLYKAIGDLWGTPSSSSNFKLPNLTGRVPVGYNAADTDTTETFGQVGATGGARGAWYHTHTISSSGAHHHASEGRVEGSGSGANIFESFNGASKTRAVNVPRTGDNGNHTHSPGSSGSAGNKLAADKANMPPYAVVKYIICAF